MGIERLIPRAASLTVDCRGVNISLTKPIWKLSNDKSVRLRYFVKRNSMLLLYCCDHHYNLCFTIPSLPFFKLYGTCCHFSFINNPSERRKYIGLFQLLSAPPLLRNPFLMSILPWNFRKFSCKIYPFPWNFLVKITLAHGISILN